MWLCTHWGGCRALFHPAIWSFGEHSCSVGFWCQVNLLIWSSYTRSRLPDTPQSSTRECHKLRVLDECQNKKDFLPVCLTNDFALHLCSVFGIEYFEFMRWLAAFINGKVGEIGITISDEGNKAFARGLFGNIPSHGKILWDGLGYVVGLLGLCVGLLGSISQVGRGTAEVVQRPFDMGWSCNSQQSGQEWTFHQSLWTFGTAPCFDSHLKEKHQRLLEQNSIYQSSPSVSCTA